MHPSSSRSKATPLRIVFWAFALGNAAIIIFRVAMILGQRIASSRKLGSRILSMYVPMLVFTELEPKAHHTWQGSDYPHLFPIERLGDVAMTLHETVRLAMNVSSPVAEEEWRQSTVMTDIGHGRVRLGPDHHIFVVAHLHQTHCLRVFQHALLGTPAIVGESDGSPEHFNHCLDYLRRTFLCAADDTLERGDFMTRDFELDRVGDTLVCEDWERLYAEMGQNYEEWNDWSEQWN